MLISSAEHGVYLLSEKKHVEKQRSRTFCIFAEAEFLFRSDQRSSHQGGASPLLLRSGTLMQTMLAAVEMTRPADGRDGSAASAGTAGRTLRARLPSVGRAAVKAGRTGWPGGGCMHGTDAPRRWRSRDLCSSWADRQSAERRASSAAAASALGAAWHRASREAGATRPRRG
jgi:hypothetical protein